MIVVPRLVAAILALPLAAASVPVSADAQGPAPVPAAGGTLVVTVGNVRAARGHVRLDVCPESMFLKDGCPFSGSAPAVKGVTTVLVHGLPPGRYAVQAYLDENDNTRVDRALFGLPKEGVGFSRDARILFGPPKFADAVFAFPGGQQAIRLSLRYFL